MGRPLKMSDCQGKCDWLPTEDQIDGHTVFQCGACTSEWTKAQSWTPRNADGEIPTAVVAERESQSH